MYSVVFDKSILHGATFEGLKSSSVGQCVNLGKLNIFYTDRFIRETLQRTKPYMARLADEFNWLVQINNVNLFRSVCDIIELELNGEQRQRDFYLRPKEEISSIIDSCTDAINGKEPSTMFDVLEKERKRNKLQRLEAREPRNSLRKDTPKTDFVFEEKYEEFVERFAESYLRYHFPDKWNDYFNFWKTERTRCEFTEHYLRAWFSTRFLPLVNRQLPIHRNDRTDAEQLAHLCWTDIFVSDDEKFMKTAFDLLYQRTGKRRMTSLQFFGFTEELVAESITEGNTI